MCFSFSGLNINESQSKPPSDSLLPINYTKSNGKYKNAEHPALDYEQPESKLLKELQESPVKKQSRSRVKLAANFSFTPVTKL